MINIVRTASRLSLSCVTNAVLIAIAGALVACTVGLTALYLVKYLDNTPALESLQCLAGLARPYCPEYAEKMATLEADLAALRQEAARTRHLVDNLQAIEKAVDNVTLFASHSDPNSGFSVTVGTVYSKLLEPDVTPNYFCYIDLGRGSANENRNLEIQDLFGAVEFDQGDLRKAGISAATMEFARSVCKPLLIERAQ